MQNTFVWGMNDLFSLQNLLFAFMKNTDLFMALKKKILLNVIPKQTGPTDVSQVTPSKKKKTCLGLTQASFEFLGVHDLFFQR